MAREREIKFCPRCGTAVTRQERFGNIRPVCPQCDYVHFSDPKVAAAVLVVQDGRVLLARRVMQPHRGKWTLPGGYINAGEDPARAAERECLEETGLSVRVTRLVDVIGGKEHERGADFVIVYQGEVLSGELSPGDDADAAKWYKFKNLPPLAFRATKKILATFL